MKPHLMRKLFLIGLNFLDIVGIIICILAYTSNFIEESFFDLETIIFMLGYVLLVNIGFYILSRFTYVEEKRVLLLITEMLMLFVTDTMFVIFHYAESLIIASSIINIILYIMILCEIMIYIWEKVKKKGR